MGPLALFEFRVRCHINENVLEKLKKSQVLGRCAWQLLTRLRTCVKVLGDLVLFKLLWELRPKRSACIDVHYAYKMDVAWQPARHTAGLARDQQGFGWSGMHLSRDELLARMFG